MRHGYHMGFGNGYGYNMGYGFWGSYILIFILVIFVTLVFILLRNKKNENSVVLKLIDILKEKYAADIINADEYIERKAIIEDARYSNPYTIVLLERYAKCAVGTKEFLSIKNEIEKNSINNSLSEKLAKGELSYDEYKAHLKK